MKESTMRQWYTMKREDSGAEIIIYDEIGKSFWNEASITAKQFLEDLNGLGEVDSITLRINSPGGDVFDGVAIHNALKNHGAKITAHIDGIAASIASYIAMAANKIVMPSNAFMLIHGSAGFVFGNADDMRSTADDLDRIDKSIVATYVSRSKSTAAKIKAIMKEDRLMDAAEAKDLGLRMRSPKK
jgi:ATP-dependent protease ClpP protease subunit